MGSEWAIRKITDNADLFKLYHMLCTLERLGFIWDCNCRCYESEDYETLRVMINDVWWDLDDY